MIIGLFILLHHRATGVISPGNSYIHRRMKTIANMGERILVHFVKDNNKPIKANFTDSILDSLGLITGNDLHIYGELQDGQMLLGNKRWTPKLQPIKMKRPAFCPIHNLSACEEMKLSDETRLRGIDVGCAVLLESADGRILLTRRAAHLHTFPGVWVPPGGHIESGETLKAAGLRELEEETGLHIEPGDCVGKSLPILAMWESAYPPMLSSGLPKRHHAVVYVYAKLTSGMISEYLQERLKPDPNEVGALAWIDMTLAHAIVRATEDGHSKLLLKGVKEDLPDMLDITVVDGNEGLVKEQLATSVLLQTAPGTENDLERVSTGTKFALEELLNNKH